MCKDADVIKLAHIIIILEQHALTLVHAQTNKYSTCRHREPGNGAGEDGCRGYVCVCVREREMHGVSSRTRSLSGTDYVMAKWSKAAGGRNKKREKTMHGLAAMLDGRLTAARALF